MVVVVVAVVVGVRCGVSSGSIRRRWVGGRSGHGVNQVPVAVGPMCDEYRRP